MMHSRNPAQTQSSRIGDCLVARSCFNPLQVGVCGRLPFPRYTREPPVIYDHCTTVGIARDDGGVSEKAWHSYFGINQSQTESQNSNGEMYT